MVQKMTVPMAYMESIIGAGGARISQIRQSSGASVTVSMADASNLSVEIRGNQTQVSTAQALVQVRGDR
jgi:predicted PilT family ATPase